MAGRGGIQMDRDARFPGSMIVQASIEGAIMRWAKPSIGLEIDRELGDDKDARRVISEGGVPLLLIDDRLKCVMWKYLASYGRRA